MLRPCARGPMAGDDAQLTTFNGLPFHTHPEFMSLVFLWTSSLPPGRVHVCYSGIVNRMAYKTLGAKKPIGV